MPKPLEPTDPTANATISENASFVPVDAADEATSTVEKWRQRAITVIAFLLGCFVFYTAAFGVFETLIQRASFVATISVLGVLLYPLGRKKSWRPIGAGIDVIIVLSVVISSIYIIVRFEDIMGGGLPPLATRADIVMGLVTTLAVLELARRAVGWLFPLLVAATIIYALVGERIPGAFGHRGFSLGFVVETIFLSDRGLWGRLVGIASRTLATFVLFGSFLLYTGAGQTFFDLSARMSGRSTGGAAKIATIASSFFGAINGSTVANVATTGNFTIPLMKRLNYPAGYAAGVEAIASTGGQLAPPIMGTAAFVMAEVVGVNYWRIAAAAVLPAILFYLGVFVTVHVIAKQQNLGSVASDDLPDWRSALDWRRLAPIVASIFGIGYGIFNGNSIETTAFFGILAMIVTFYIASLTAGDGLWATTKKLLGALEDGGKGVVVVGVLLTAAQVFVAMLNLTGLGIAITSVVLAVAGDSIWLIALLMGVVCLIAGMGLPTSAAYILVSVVFAPALIQLGINDLTVHFFVLFYATLSVITPPVCVGVFVAAAIAQESWLKVASYAMRLGATAYALPLLFLLYPGMLGRGGGLAIVQAVTAGVTFTLAVAFFFGGQPVFNRNHDRYLWLAPLLLAAVPFWSATIVALLVLAGLVYVATVFTGSAQVSQAA